MAALAFLLASLWFALVGFGVTVFGPSEFHNLAGALALLAFGLALGGVPKINVARGS